MAKKQFLKLQFLMAKNDAEITDVAKWLGMSSQAVYNRLNGKTPFSVRDIEVLSQKLRIKRTDVLDVFGFKIPIENNVNSARAVGVDDEADFVNY